MNGMFSIPFVQMALLSGGLLGTMCSIVGIYVILKRIVFVGVALNQTASMGIAFALLFQLNPTLSALAFTFCCTLLFSFRLNLKALPSIPREGTIGLAYIVASAASLLMIAMSSQGEAHLLNLLMGDIAATTGDDLILVISTLLPLAILLILFHKEILLVSFDYEMAGALRMRPQLWETGFYLVLGVLISVATQVAGPLLTFGYLVIPPMAALMVTKKMSHAFVVASIFSCISTFGGIAISFHFENIPSGPAIIGVAFAFLILCWGLQNIKILVLLTISTILLAVVLVFLPENESQSNVYESQETILNVVQTLSDDKQVVQEKMSLPYLGTGSFEELFAIAYDIEISSVFLYDLTDDPLLTDDPFLDDLLLLLEDRASSLKNVAMLRQQEQTVRRSREVVQLIDLLKANPSILKLTPERNRVLFTEETTTLNGHHHECFLLQSNETLDYAFQAKSKVDFSIFYNDEFEVRVPIQHSNVSKMEDHFQAKDTRVYCLAWNAQNDDSQTLQYQFQLSPHFR